MPKVEGSVRQQNKEKAWLWVKRSPNGITEAELEAKSGIQRRTLNNYLRELEYEGKIYKDGLLWLALDFDGTRLRSFDLSPEEAYTLYLATRLLVKQHDKRNEPAETALMKLAHILTTDAKVGAEIAQAAQELSSRPANPGYQDVFRTLVRGYIYRKAVRITYRPLNGRSFETVFRTYLMEPSAIGFSTYAIGHSSLPNEIRSYKIERIQSAELTKDRYTVPDDFPGLEILRNAWSIISGDETVRVILRFSSEVRERVLETQWHPSQDWDEDQEKPGWLRWWVDVADTLDMLPWVRSWGMDAEILEPNSMKKDVIEHVSHLATLYKIVQPNSEIEPYQRLWAKADRKTATIHRLIYHMIDVGLTAKTIWQQSLHPKLKEGLATWLSLSVDEVGCFVAFLASLHDLGKASPAFQDHPRMNSRLRNRILSELCTAGFSFVENRPSADRRARHEVISTWALRPTDGEALLSSILQLPDDLAVYLAQALGGHHGAWPRPDLFAPARLKPADKGGDEWAEARRKLVQTMHQAFQPPTIYSFKADLAKDNVMLTLLSALVSTADWIGSDDEYFPYEDLLIPLAAYVRHAQKHAEAAIARIGWTTPVSMPKFDFERVFPFKPNDAQNEISSAIANIDLPAMIIIENQMGAGKTESAFSTCAQWAQRSGSSGLYIAMPTTATSNQMHTRTSAFLTRQIGKEVEPLLVHSQALLRDVPASGDPVEQLEHEGDAAAGQAWFLPRKKSLLAAYGVGTVDQALMGILQTKHFFVRLLGLSYKTVIFDEVHAYDAYMSELFERLLVWLRAVGTSVIILSATLPEKARQKLVKAYTGDTSAVAPAADYPRITYADAKGEVNALSLTPPPPKTLYIDWVSREEDQVIAKLQDLLANGGCAAVICNTVTRAQKLFQAIRSLSENLCPEEDLILFHARFPMAWREEIEQKVVRKFGPGSEKGKPNLHRPSKAIVVATQVIEQSLDLDFDVMISDHAPVDLLLQRSGRLQRHGVNNPRHHPNCLWIAEPTIEDGVPKFDRSDKFVYAEYVLLRSWLVLKRLEDNQITVPRDLSALIENVYGPESRIGEGEVLQRILETAKRELKKREVDAEDIAMERVVLEPTHKKLLTQRNMSLGDEDDPAVNAAFRALTRLGDPGISVVCLHNVDGKLFLNPANSTTLIDPSVATNKRMTLDLAKHSIQVRHSDPNVSIALLNEPLDSRAIQFLQQWKRVAALRFHRVLIFEKGTCQLPGTQYIVSLDSIYGMRIQEAK